MTTSVKAGQDRVKEWFAKQTDIETVVDLGPGSGTFPKLLGKDKYIWKAVEIWAPYIERFNLYELYEEIRIGDIQYMELPDADCCIAASVLEHLSKEVAKGVFVKIDKQYKHVVVRVPLESDSQLVFEGNIFESHQSVWTQEELDAMIPDTYERISGIKREMPAMYFK